MLFIGGFFTIIAAIVSQSYFPIIAMIPACIKLLPNFIPLFSSHSLKEDLLEISKYIGLRRGKSIRYKRPKATETLLTFDTLYLTIVILQFIMMHFISTGQFDIYLIAGLIIFLLNSSITRFADEQTVWCLILSLATCTMIQSFHGSYLLLLILSYWILISPFPSVVKLGLKYFLKLIPLTGYVAPVYIRPIMDKFNNFFSPVSPEKKILMAFQDPGNKYGEVFDGLRFHIEFPLYSASQKRILLFPDWMAIVQFNYWGAVNYWGKEPVEVLQNLKIWNADYAMIYQKDLNMLDPKWTAFGFRVISHCTWKSNELKGQDGCWFPYMDVSWWLIEKPD
jgi:hypothetical protein